MVHGGKALEDGSADGAQDEQSRQTGVAHECAPQQSSTLVLALYAAREHAHHPVRQRDRRVLTPPAVQYHGHVETCMDLQHECVETPLHRIHYVSF